MELLWTTNRCLLCGGGINRPKNEHGWAQQFTVVFLESDGVRIGHFDYKEEGSVQRVETRPGLSRRLRIDNSNACLNRRTFAFHFSCQELLDVILVPGPSPKELFNLCRVLNPNECRTIDLIVSSKLPGGVTDPFLPLLPHPLPAWLQNLDISPKPSSDTPGLLRLPVEVLSIILQRISLSDLINFLCSAKQLLPCTPLALNHRSMTTFEQFTGSKSSDYRRVILALYSRYHRTGYAGFEEKWKAISRVNSLSSHIRQMRAGRAQQLMKRDGNPSLLSTYDPSHSTEYRPLTVQLPNRVQKVRLYTARIDDCHYVVGLDIHNQSVGRISTTFVDIDIPGGSLDIIGFGQDEIGIRTLKFGDSSWSHNSPEALNCWEGFSKRRCSAQLETYQDPLKIRRVSWATPGPPSFPEQILAKGTHPFWHGSISQHDFISTFGQEPIIQNRPVGVVWFNDLRSLTLYHTHQITGISIQTDKGTSIYGSTEDQAVSLSFEHPEEFVTEMIVHKSNLIIGFELRTNLHKKISIFHDRAYAGRELRSCPERRLKGFYFQMSPIAIESIGYVYEHR